MVEKTVTISVTLTTAYSDGSTSNETGTGTISFDSLNVPFKQRLKLESELFKHLSTVANNRLQNRLSNSSNQKGGNIIGAIASFFTILEPGPVPV